MNQFICKSGWTSVFKLVLSVWPAELWSLGGSISKFDSLLEPHSCCHDAVVCYRFVQIMCPNWAGQHVTAVMLFPQSLSRALLNSLQYFVCEDMSCWLKNYNVASLIGFLLFSSFCVFVFAVFLIGAEACHNWNVSFLAEILCDHLQLNTQLF